MERLAFIDAQESPRSVARSRGSERLKDHPKAGVTNRAAPKKNDASDGASPKTGNRRGISRESEARVLAAFADRQAPFGSTAHADTASGLSERAAGECQCKLDVAEGGIAHALSGRGAPFCGATGPRPGSPLPAASSGRAQIVPLRQQPRQILSTRRRL